MNTVDDYCEELGLKSIWDLDLLDMEGGCSRLALPDGENSIWVCDSCGELSDPDPDFAGCDCYTLEDDEDD